MKIDPLSISDIERLRPLWLSLHAHHQNVAPRLAPFVSNQQSWAGRKQQYEEVLSNGGFSFITHNDLSDIGYLMCVKKPMRWTATFATPSILWELVTLFVDPEHRGKGIGSMMLDRMDETIASSPTQTKLVGVIPDNCRAIALYQSRGFSPIWLTLTRFQQPPIATTRRAEVEIKKFAADDVNPLKSLWMTLHHYYQTVSPHLGSFVDDEHSWLMVKDLLAKSAQDGLLIVAREGSELTGFVGVIIHTLSEMPEYSDTWMTGDKIAETKFLVVAEGNRGREIGTALMDAVDAELVQRGICDHLISTIESNKRAIRFHESRGFCPTWLELLKQ